MIDNWTDRGLRAALQMEHHRKVSVVTHSHYQEVCGGKLPRVYLHSLIFLIFFSLFFIFKRGFFFLLDGSNSAGQKNLYSIYQWQV